MANNPYFKSLIWLVLSGAAGYGLLRLTAPSQEKLEKIKATASRAHLSEEEEKKVLLMKHMKDAATGAQQPIYLQNKKGQ